MMLKAGSECRRFRVLFCTGYARCARTVGQRIQLILDFPARPAMHRDAHRQIARNSVKYRTRAAITIKMTRGDDQPTVMQTTI
jgi:hypothetical protein